MAQASVPVGSYEIQVYANGQWRSVATFDDRLRAVDQAKELAENPRFLSVKVVKEQFDELRKLYVKQTVYRSAPVRDESPEMKERRGEAAFKRMGDRRRQRLSREQQLRQVRQAKRQQTAKQIRFALGLAFRLLLILGVGLGILYWIMTQY